MFIIDNNKKLIICSMANIGLIQKAIVWFSMTLISIINYLFKIKKHIHLISYIICYIIYRKWIKIGKTNLIFNNLVIKTLRKI